MGGAREWHRSASGIESRIIDSNVMHRHLLCAYLESHNSYPEIGTLLNCGFMAAGLVASGTIILRAVEFSNKLLAHYQMRR
jgi:hypothetical protein